VARHVATHRSTHGCESRCCSPSQRAARAPRARRRVGCRPPGRHIVARSTAAVATISAVATATAVATTSAAVALAVGSATHDGDDLARGLSKRPRGSERKPTEHSCPTARRLPEMPAAAGDGAASDRPARLRAGSREPTSGRRHQPRRCIRQHARPRDARAPGNRTAGPTARRDATRRCAGPNPRASRSATAHIQP
jgi:hypothetical protein